MALNGNHLDSGLTTGTRSAIISSVLIFCSIICHNGWCQKQPHAGPRWHAESETRACQQARAAWLTLTLHLPPHSLPVSPTPLLRDSGGKTLYGKEQRSSITCRSEWLCSCVWGWPQPVWSMSACRWCPCMDVEMKSDPDWTSSSQEPLPEFINHILWDTAMCALICTLCVYASLNVPMEFSFHFLWLSWSDLFKQHLVFLNFKIAVYQVETAPAGLVYICIHW